MISGSTVVVASVEQVSCELEQEMAVLSLKNGVYYGLNPLAARIWSMIQEPTAVGVLRDRLIEEYDTEPERCYQDLVALLERLLAEGLVELSDAPRDRPHPQRI